MHYPSVLRRYLASIIDLLVQFGLFGLLAHSPLLNLLGDKGAWMLVVIWLVYEPLLTAYAFTLGQGLMRYRVRRTDGRQQIALWRSYLRTVLKSSLGLVSLLTIPARQDRRALHDLWSGTLVVDARASNAGPVAGDLMPAALPEASTE